MITSIKQFKELYETNEIGSFGWEFTYTYEDGRVVNVLLQNYSKEVENEFQLSCNTDGYHWLNFFLSQKNNATELIENYTIEQENEIINDFFNMLELHYKVEDKDSAIIIGNIDDEKAKQIAYYIDDKFKNRSNFY